MSTSGDQALTVQRPCSRFLDEQDLGLLPPQVWSPLVHISAVSEVALDFLRLENCHLLQLVLNQDALLPPGWTFSNAYMKAPIFIIYMWKPSQIIKWQWGKRQLWADLVKDTPGQPWAAPSDAGIPLPLPANAYSGVPSSSIKQSIVCIDLKCPLKAHARVPLWFSSLRIWWCHCYGSGHYCGPGSIPGPGTSTCCKHGQINKCIIFKKIYKKIELPCLLGYFGGFFLLLFWLFCISGRPTLC